MKRSIWVLGWVVQLLFRFANFPVIKCDRSGGSNPPVEEPPKNNLPPSGIFDVVGPVDNKSPSSPSSKRSGDDLMQRFTSLTEPSKAPGNGAEIPRGDVAPPRPATLPAWAFAPVVPPERGTGAAGAERPEFQSNGRNPQEPAIPAWALPEDAPPGDWGSRRYPPSYPGRWGFWMTGNWGRFMDV
eukprot:symbB.v1.2.001013.t1/scaffold52.1/size380577/3